jgi:hypothetical protein
VQFKIYVAVLRMQRLLVSNALLDITHDGDGTGMGACGTNVLHHGASPQLLTAGL